MKLSRGVKDIIKNFLFLNLLASAKVLMPSKCVGDASGLTHMANITFHT